MAEAFICDAARSPIGRFGGALARVRADDLAAHPIRALLKRNPSLSSDAIDEVVLGAANQAGEDNRNVGRMAALLAGLPASVPGVTVNRLCASGLEAVGTAARSIRCGEADLVIAGGAESMTRAPFVMAKSDGAFSRAAELCDTTIGWRFINSEMRRLHGVDSMPETAENVAFECDIDRADQDAFAYRSLQRAARAQAVGLFAREIVPIEIIGRNGTSIVDTDEHPRADTTIESLAKLKPIVRPDGTVTAGNASGVNDGSAAMIIASEAAARRHGLEPRGRIIGMASGGVPPRTMGLGPVPATVNLCSRLGINIGSFDVIELNEAFAAQALGVMRALGLQDEAEHVNPNGGAIAWPPSQN